MAYEAVEPSRAASEQGRRGGALLIGLVLAGALIAITLGVYARLHPPARRETLQLLFSATLPFKVWITTLVLALAVFQVVSAMRLYERVGPGRAPDWLGQVHRLSGTLAFIASLPVAFHCLWSIGFTPASSPRALVHSALGCLFYGAIVVKVGAVRSHQMPGWTLPVVGGIVFTALTGLWVTSSLWFFMTVGLQL
jgi:hypothetical protein